MFPDDRTCASYLSQLRWPDGFVCPSCKIASTQWNESRGRLTFRFNRRTSKSRGLLFRRLLEQAVVTSPATMADIIHVYDYDWKSVD